MSQPLHKLTAVDAAAGIASRTFTAEALLRSCLERIEEREADVGAWTYLDRDGAIAAARTIDRTSGSGLLRGVPIGIKDVVDTADMPIAEALTHEAGNYAGMAPDFRERLAAFAKKS